jgi:hypothetical protein
VPAEDQHSQLPEFNENWNMGKIEIVINRCCECRLHFDYSRHSEDELIAAFNEIGGAISEIFP